MSKARKEREEQIARDRAEANAGLDAVLDSLGEDLADDLIMYPPFLGMRPRVLAQILDRALTDPEAACELAERLRGDR